MFSTSNKKEPKLETIIGSGTEIQGDLHIAEGIRVDGKVKGAIQAESIVVGVQGVIFGDITAGKVTISGKIKGNVTANAILELLPQGQILGDIKTSKLIISDGAKFEGNCQMVKSDGQIIELNPDVIGQKSDHSQNGKNLKVLAESGKK